MGIAEVDVNVGIDRDVFPVPHLRALVPSQRQTQGFGQRLDLRGQGVTDLLVTNASSRTNLGPAFQSVGVGSGKVTPVSCSDNDQSRRAVAGSWAAAMACTSMGVPRISWKPEGP